MNAHVECKYLIRKAKWRKKTLHHASLEFSILCQDGNLCQFFSTASDVKKHASTTISIAWNTFTENI